MSKLLLTGITHPGEFELADGLTALGRNPTNDFRVPDATVSSFHCEFIVTGPTVVVRDLNSTNGTFIDDQQIQEAILKPGQVLRLGQAEMKIESKEAGEEVQIAIPKVSGPKVEVQTHLLDGSLACIDHPGVAAIVRCNKCDLAFCGDCVHALSVSGGRSRLFCPRCSNPVETLPELAGGAEKKKRSFFARLTQTIRIRQQK